MTTNLRAELIAAIRRDAPPFDRLVPTQCIDAGVEQRTLVELEPSCDALAVLADLEPVGELLRGKELHLFQQVEDNSRSRCHRTGPGTVPVPHATEIACLLDDSEIRHTGLPQVVPGENAGPPAAEDNDVDVVADGTARRPCHVRVAEVDCPPSPGMRQRIAPGHRAEVADPALLDTCLSASECPPHRGRHRSGIAGHLCSPSVSCDLGVPLCEMKGKTFHRQQSSVR